MTQPTDDDAFLIDKILPTEETHILGGPSGAGKTRWLFQMLMNWSNGKPILGFDSHPVPYVYVSTDRSQKSVYRTLEDLGIARDQIPIIAAVEREPKGEQGYTIPWLLDLIDKEHSKAKLIICEGLATFIPNGKINEYAPVTKFLRGLTREMQRRHKTFLGVVHTAKAKGEQGGYDNPREKLMGSAGWAAYAETIFVLDFYSSKDAENQYRKMYVLPRNHAPNMVRNFKQLGPEEGGRLIELTRAQATMAMPVKTSNRGRPRETLSSDALENYLAALEATGAKSFDLTEAEKALEGSMSRATIYRRINELAKAGTLEKEARGTYLIVRKSVMDVFVP